MPRIEDYSLEALNASCKGLTSVREYKVEEINLIGRKVVKISYWTGVGIGNPAVSITTTVGAAGTAGAALVAASVTATAATAATATAATLAGAAMAAEGATLVSASTAAVAASNTAAAAITTAGTAAVAAWILVPTAVVTGAAFGGSGIYNVLQDWKYVYFDDNSNSYLGQSQDDAIRSLKNKARDLNTQGDNLYNDGNYEEAAVKYQEAMDFNATKQLYKNNKAKAQVELDAIALKNEGDIAFNEGRYDDARNKYQGAKDTSKIEINQAQYLFDILQVEDIQQALEESRKEQEKFAKFDEENLQKAIELSVKWFAAEELGREAIEKVDEAKGKVDSSLNKGSTAKKILLKLADNKIAEAINKLEEALEHGTPKLILESLVNCQALCTHYGNYAAIERVKGILAKHFPDDSIPNEQQEASLISYELSNQEEHDHEQGVVMVGAAANDID